MKACPVRTRPAFRRAVREPLRMSLRAPQPQPVDVVAFGALGLHRCIMRQQDLGASSTLQQVATNTLTSWYLGAAGVRGTPVASAHTVCRSHDVRASSATHLMTSRTGASGEATPGR